MNAAKLNVVLNRIDFDGAYEATCMLAVLAAIPLAFAGYPSHAMAGVVLAGMKLGR